MAHVSCTQIQLHNRLSDMCVVWGGKKCLLVGVTVHRMPNVVGQEAREDLGMNQRSWDTISQVGGVVVYCRLTVEQIAAGFGTSTGSVQNMSDIKTRKC